MSSGCVLVQRAGYQRFVQLIGFQWRIFKKSLKIFFCYPGIVYFYPVSALTQLGPLLFKSTNTKL